MGAPYSSFHTCGIPLHLSYESYSLRSSLMRLCILRLPNKSLVGRGNVSFNTIHPSVN